MAVAGANEGGLKRDIGLWQGTALNIIDMVGIGPFVTLPLILAAMGGGRALGAWILGAVLAIYRVGGGAAPNHPVDQSPASPPPCAGLTHF